LVSSLVIVQGMALSYPHVTLVVDLVRRQAVARLQAVPHQVIAHQVVVHLAAVHPRAARPQVVRQVLATLSQQSMQQQEWAQALTLVKCLITTSIHQR